MAFDWNQYLKHAGELRNSHEEAHQRTAISRSYYSAFNIARLFLEAKQRPANTDNHERFWSQVREVTGDIELQTMGQRTRRLRHKADYKCDFPKIGEELRVAMQNCTLIIHKISKLDRTPEPILPGSALK